MKWYKILVSGRVSYIAKSENEAIQMAEQDIQNYGKVHELSIFAISEEE